MKAFTTLSLVALSTAYVINPETQNYRIPGGVTLSRRQDATTANDIKDGKCAGMTILFARGTTEPGNVGLLAGPPFFDQVKAMTGGDVAVQGIDYPADIPGFLAGGDKNGSALMAQTVGQVRSACPTTKLVMAGYRYVLYLPSTTLLER